MVDPLDDAFETVHVELDWYDGPRAGVADINGVPHYFRAVHDYAHPDDPDDEYLVWPAVRQALSWEREQWDIFVKWNTRYENGTATVDGHPGHGGVDARYDELTALLQPHRATPGNAERLGAEWRSSKSPYRYGVHGPGYSVRWRIT